MKKKALRKDFYMEVRKSLHRFLSIFLIVALGVAFFSGIRASKPDMRLSADAYFDESNLLDFTIVSTLGLTEDDVKKISEVDGIKDIMPSYAMDFLCDSKDSELVVETFSMPDNINQLTIVEGRFPETSNECIADERLLNNSDYKIGDKIVLKSGTEEATQDLLKEKEFTIVGSGRSPYYLSLERGSSNIGNGSVTGFLALPKEVYKSDVYQKIYLTTDKGKDFLCYSDGYEDYIENISKDIELIQKEQCEIRYNDVINDASEKINNAKDQVSDAKRKLDDGKKQLEDANDEITKNEKDIEDAEDKLTSAKQELAKKETQLEQGLDAIKVGKEEIRKAKESIKLMENQATSNEELVAVTYAKNQLKLKEEELSKTEKEIEKNSTKFNTYKETINSNESDLTQGKEKLLEAKSDYEEALKTYEEEKETAEKEIIKAEDDIKEGEDKINKIDFPEWYIMDRNYIKTYVEYGQDAERIGAIGEVFPLIFFLVAALVSLTTMTRMVEEERTQIGTLKALGYSKWHIAKKYIYYALLASVLGSILGLIIGQKILPMVVINAYAILYNNLPEVLTPINMYYSVSSTLAAVFCTTLATVFACYKELSHVPSVLMRPQAPKSGKRVLIERISFFWNRLNFTKKATLRNLFRYKKRFFMTVFGIGGCMSLLIVGFGIKDSISAVGTIQFGKIRVYDATFTLDDKVSAESKKNLEDKLYEDKRIEGFMYAYEAAMDVGKGTKLKDGYLIVPENKDKFSDYINLTNRTTKEHYSLPSEGAIITEKLAKLLEVSVGDTIYLKNSDVSRVNVTVAGIVENYFLHYVYMSQEAYEKAFNKMPNYNEIYTNNSEDKVEFENDFRKDYLQEDTVSGVSFISATSERVFDMLKSMDIVIYVLVISAGLLAFVVLYNLNNINISERQKELATLKVLGFYDKEVSSYVFKENILITIIGIILGIFMGGLLHRFVIVTAEIDMLMFGRFITLKSFIYSIVLTVLFSVFVNIFTHFKLKKIDMTESLKSNE